MWGKGWMEDTSFSWKGKRSPSPQREPKQEVEVAKKRFTSDFGDTYGHFSWKEAVVLLKQYGLNNKGSFSGQIFKRLYLYSLIEKEVQNFDSEDIQHCITKFRETPKDFFSKISKEPQWRRCYGLYQQLQFLLPQELQEESKAILGLEEIQRLLYDCRKESGKQTNAELEIDKKCAELLGFDRDDIYDLDPKELLKKVKESLCRPEYKENLDHFKHNMMQLFLRVKKQQRVSLQSQGETIPQLLKKGYTGPRESLDQLQQHIFHRLGDLTLAEKSIVCKELGILDGGPEDDTALILRHDEICETLQRALVLVVDRQRRATIVVEDIHDSLPSLQSTTSRQQEGCAFIDKECILRKTTRVGSTEIREIGIRCDGTFRYILDDQGDLPVPPNASILKWISPESGIEEGKDLEHILYANTPDRRWLKYLFFQVGDEFFKVNLQARTVESEHPGFLNYRCRPIDVKSDGSLLGCENIFRRLVLQIKSDVHLCDHSIEYQFTESGIAIAQAISFMTSTQSKSNRDMHRIRDSPLLMYNTSAFMRTVIIPSLNEFQKKKWKAIHNSYDKPFLQEAKQALMQLIVAGPGEKLIAVVKKEHLNHIQELLFSYCHYPFHQFVVEKSNLQAVLRSLDDLISTSNLAICSLHITGRLSGNDINRLLSRTVSGSLRLLILHYNQLTYQLRMTGKLNNVILPTSLGKARVMEYTTYESCEILHSIFKHTQEKFSHSPYLLRLPMEGFVKRHQEGLKWKQNERDWRDINISNKSPDLAKSLYRLLISANVALVERYYLEERNCDASVAIIDCADGDFERALNSRMPFEQADLGSQGEKDTAGGCPVLVVLNAHLLSDSQRHYVASKSRDAFCKFLFVFETFNPEDTLIRIKKPNTNEVFTLQGEMWQVLPDYAELRSIFGVNLTKYRALRLILGSLLPIAGPQASTESLADLVNTQQPSVSREVVETCVNYLDLLLSVDKPEPSFRHLYEFIVFHAVAHIRANPHSLEQDVTFESFVTTVPLCQFLTQEDRIESWIRSVLCTEDGRLEQIVAPFRKTAAVINVHSVHLLAYILLPKDTRRPEARPVYTYVERDASVGTEELLLQQCIQCNELAWGNLASEWRIFPHSLDFLMKLLLVYPQPLKLLFSISPISLYNMLENATRSRYPEVISKLAAYLSNSTLVEILQASSHSAAAFISILKWSLLSTGNAEAKEGLTLNDKDVQVILDFHIPLSVKHAAFIIPLVLKLDAPADIIYQQVHLRQYFLDLPIEESGKEIFNKDLKLGKAFLDFVFNHRVIHHSKNCGESTFISHTICKELIQWLEDGKPMEHLKHITHRFSQKAIAFLISSSSSAAHTRSAFGVCSPYFSLKDSNLSAVINDALSFGVQFSQMILFLDEAKTSMLKMSQLKTDNQFMDALWQSLQKDSIEPLRNMLRQEEGRKANIPVEVSPTLLALVIKGYSDSQVNFPNEFGGQVIDELCSWFSDDGLEAAAIYLESNRESTTKYRFFTLLAWLRAPYNAPPFLPQGIEDEFFQKMIKHPAIKFEDIVKRNLAIVSNFAIFLTCPYYLSTATVNHFRKEMNKELIPEKLFVICQKGQQAAAYSIRVPQRSLPMQLLASLVGRNLDLKIWEESRNAREFFSDTSGSNINVTSGFTVEIFTSNLSALLNLLNDKVTFNIDGVELTDSPTNYFLVVTLLSWLWSSGIGMLELERFLEGNVEQWDILKRLEILEEKVAIARGSTPLEEMPTKFPLPSFIDTKLSIPNHGGFKLLGDTTDDIIFTYQCFTSFMDPTTTRPLKDYLLKESKNGVEVTQPQNAYHELHVYCSQEFGYFITKQAKQTQQSSDKWNLRDLDRKMSLFTDCLMIVCQMEGDGPILASAISTFVEGASRGFDGNKNDSLWQAMLSRCFISNVGSVNSGSKPLLSNFIGEWEKKGFSFCMHTVQEHSWICENGFPGVSFPHKAKSRKVLRQDEDVALTRSWLEKNPPEKPHLNWIQETLAVNSVAPSGIDDSAPVPKQINSSTSSVSSFRFLQPATQGEPEKPSGVQKHKGVYSGAFYFKSDSSRRVVMCHNLLEVSSEQGHGVLRVKPGIEGYLKRVSSENAHLLEFVQADSLMDSIDSVSLIEASFPNNNVAWNTISSTSPPLTLLILEGILLKKSADNSKWIPIILAYDAPFIPNFPNLHDSVYNHVYFWHALDLYALLSCDLDDSVINFLQFLCCLVYKISKGSYGNKDIKDVLVWFRNLEQPGEENSKLHPKLVAIADRLTDFIKEVINTSNNRSVQSTVDSIIKHYLEKMHEDYDKYSENFVDELRGHIMRLNPQSSKALSQILDHGFAFHGVLNSISVIANNSLMNGLTPEGLLHESAPVVLLQGEDGSGFPSKIGFGRPAQRNRAVSLVGPAPPILYYYLDKVIYKQQYSSASGCVIMYLFHASLFNGLEHTAASDVKWLVDVLRSPLSDDFKQWFLDMSRGQLFTCAPPIMPHLPNAPEHLSTLVIANCLARNYPNRDQHKQDKHKVFLNACLLPESLESFCRRRNDKYGVYFCNTHTLTEMRKAGLHMEVIDLGILASSGMESIDSLYQRVISLFSGFNCFVYVQGLNTIDDLFLKWCCEYTERCPWRFIYFENTDSSFNFPENRDRCETLFFEKASMLEWKLGRVGSSMEIRSVKYLSRQEEFDKVAVDEKWKAYACIYFGDPDDWPKLAVAESEWEKKFDSQYNNDQCVLFLISPPGAGKSEKLKDLVSNEQRECRIVDCSNDELVERAMYAVLTEKFPHTGKPSLLVADEYHMLSDEHKEQLFSWITDRLSWLKVVLIGNRRNEKDDELLQLIETPHIAKLPFKEARLSVEKILKIYSTESTSIFLEDWHRACRALFGDEILTLRNVDRLKHVYNDKSKARDKLLGDLLMDKMPKLGELFCYQFSLYFLDLHASRKYLVKNHIPDKFPSKLLVRTALLTPTACCSFPEFTNHLPRSHEAHPIIRIAAWIIMVHTSQNLEVPNLDCLQSLDVIDQIGFPYVSNTNSLAVSLKSCEAFCKRGDYTDIQWMKDAIAHGYTMDWDSVKESWQSLFLTNSSELEGLLSVCPDPAACLDALHPKNLSLLIESSKSGKLSAVVTKYLHVGAEEETKPDSPYFTAAWHMFRNQSEPYHVDLFSEDILGRMLCWASQYGYYHLNVVSSPESRRLFLRQVLNNQTRKLLVEHKEATSHRQSEIVNTVVQFWAFGFSSLLFFGRGSFKNSHGNEEGMDGVPYQTALILAHAQYPPNTEWPELVKVLSAILHFKSDMSSINALLDHELFTNLRAINIGDPAHEFTIPGKPYQFVEGILSAPGNLSKAWSYRLLTTPNVSIPDKFSTQEKIGKLQKGLLVLRNSAQLQITEGRVKSRLVQLLERQSRKQKKQKSEFTWKVEHGQKQKDDHNMRFNKRFTNHKEILQYYNVHAGAKPDELGATDFDNFKNPKGSKYDLGRDRAFGEFTILVGIFFRRTNEFERDSFCQTAKKALEEKGFYVALATTESEFISSLDNCDIGWIISGDAMDWNARVEPGVEKWRNLATACEKFHRSGRGLFIFADNEPFFDHANVVLERIASMTLKGNTPGDKTLTAGQASKSQQFGSNLITCGLQHLYEGKTISFPTRLGKLSVLATSSDGEAVLLFGDNVDSVSKEGTTGNLDRLFGRIVVDTGFTKLWKEWDSAGTARYVCNATIWLLGLEYRLNNNLSLKGPLTSNPILSNLNTPVVEPKETNIGKVDVILVIDGSGSVGPDDFGKMKEFSKKLVKDVRVSSGGIHFGVVQFATKARTEVPLCCHEDTILAGLNGMRWMAQGTSFDHGLLQAQAVFSAGGRSGAKKIIFFQTDGEGTTEVASRLHDLGIEIFALGIGSVSEANLAPLASKPQREHIYTVADYNQIYTILEKLLKICQAA